MDSFHWCVWIYTTIWSQWYWYPGPLLATGGHQSPHWQETPRLSWLEDYSICQCMIINVWLIMKPEDVISIFLCSKASVMSTKSSLQSLLTHPLARSACEGDLWRHWAWRHVDLRCHHSTALCGIPRRLEMTGALIPVLLRTITLHRCRIVVRGLLGQYQYYCMFYLVAHIVGSNFKLKIQEVSGFSNQWVLNAMVDFN